MNVSALPHTPARPPRLVAIPQLMAGGRWRVEAMRSLSEPVLLWFTKGQGRITLAGHTRGFTASNAVFIPAGIMHGFDANSSVFGQALFFGDDHGLVLPKQSQHLRIRESFAAQELNLNLEAMQREIEGDKPGHLRAAAHYMGLVSVWLERQSDKASNLGAHEYSATAAKRLVARYLTLLERGFRSNMGVSDYAAALGITPTHLTRCCQITAGRSALSFLHDRRIFEARQMLLGTSLPVSRIAQHLGFASLAYFSRCFQHHTGESPSDFRKTALCLQTPRIPL